MLLTLFVDALGAYLIADGLIGSRSMRESFIKAGLFGEDLNNMFGVYMLNCFNSFTCTMLAKYLMSDESGCIVK